MARITEMPKGIEPVWIHDVTHPVSWKWFQYRDDVLLLQYALNKIIAKGELTDHSVKATPGPIGPIYPPLASLKVDGVFGRKSHAALVAYQGTYVCGSNCVMVDGDVDPVYKYMAGIGSDMINPRNMSMMMNVSRLTMFKLNRDILQLYGRMMRDEELPAEVQTALRTQHR